MAEMKTLNGFEVVDTKARADIEVLKGKEPDLSNYYTKAEVDEEIANLDIPEAEVDLSNYYTKAETYNKTEVDNKIASAGGGGGGSSGTWHTTYDTSEGGLYSCQGVCVMAQDNSGNTITSTVIFGSDDQLGNHNHTYYTFSDIGEYNCYSWYYNGSSINSDSASITHISYLM